MEHSRRPVLVAATIIAALTVFRFWASSQMGLAPDEAYYWLWSRAPAAGYFDHPPMVAWWIWASTEIFGDTEFGIRAFSVLAGVVTAFAVFATGRNLALEAAGSARGALWFNATILVGVGAILISPDSPSVMFWALAVWVLADIRRGGEGWLWLLVGLFAGLGCLSKYTNLFLGGGILLWLIADREARRWFRSPWLWAGGVVAALVFVPVVLWNAEHGWISFGKQFGRISADGVDLRYVGEFVASQIGLLNPLIAIFVGIGAWRALRALARRNGETSHAILFLFALSLPLLAYLVFHSFHARVQGNWPAPVYPSLALIAAVAASAVSSRLLGGIAALAAPVGIVVPVGALLFFISPFPLPWLDRSPAERLVGWRDLAGQVERLRQEHGAGWIATADYGLTGELAFYGPGPELVQQVDERQRYLFDTVDTGVVGTPALLVLPKERSELRKFRRCFASIEPVTEIGRPGPGGAAATYTVSMATGARLDILKRGCR